MNKWIYIPVVILLSLSIYVFLPANTLLNFLEREIDKDHIKGSWVIGTVNGSVLRQSNMNIFIEKERLGMAYYNDEGECEIKNLPIESIEKNYIETKKTSGGNFVSMKVVDYDVHSDGKKEVTFIINSITKDAPSGISSGNKIRMYESRVVSASCNNGNLITTNNMDKFSN